MDEKSPSQLLFPGEDGYGEEDVEDLEDASDSDSEDEARTDSRDRFRMATRAMEDKQHKFSEPQVLYDFLYEFRDVVRLVMEDSNTFLHVALRLINNHKDVRSSNMMPLIQGIVKDHPTLLTRKNSDGMTPLFMAIATRKPLLIEAMLSNCAEYPEWLSAVQDSIEIPCVEKDAKTCLHIAFQLGIRERVVIKLMDLARDTAFDLQDTHGRTPLHYAINSQRQSLATMQLFIHRDDEILSKRQAKSSSDTITFLDLVDDKGRSVYMYHQTASRDKELGLSLLEIFMKPPSSSTGRTPIDTKRRSRRKTPKRSSKSGDGEVSKHQLSVVPDLQKESIGSVSVKQGIEKKKDKYRKPRNELTNEEWDGILKELKLHYMRTRKGRMVESFLYGSNIDDIQFYFDFSGLPSSIEAGVFADTFSNLKFDATLQYVSFPDIKVNWKGGQKTKSNRKDRRDMAFFFDWLQTKGVHHIIKVDVEDSKKFPHSDQAISESFNTITVEQFNWSKVDLDPRVICRLGSKLTWGHPETNSFTTCNSQIREVTLYWSGNNTALRAWSEPQGLSSLPKLRKITIVVPADDEIRESPAWVSACLEEFRQRIAKTVSRRTNSSVPSNEEPNSKDSMPTDSSDIGPGERDIEIFLITSGSKDQNLENLNALGQPLPSVESRAGHRWLDSVYAFADNVKRICDQSLSDDVKPKRGSATPGDVLVALIDDGVNAYGSATSRNIIGGKSFAFDERTNAPSPWYVSELGHGTIMAETITRVCPMVKIYPIRVNTEDLETGEPTLKAKSVRMAVETAIERNAKIIVIPLPIENIKSNPRDRASIENVLQKAYDLNILFFLPPYKSEGSQASYIFRHEATFWIGEAGDDGGALNRTNFPLEAHFIFPGCEVMIQHDVDNRRRSDGEIADLNSSSNVNVALAAGLAAVLIYAFKLVVLETREEARSIEQLSVDDDNTSQLTNLHGHHDMMNAFQILGSVTESRFLKVWEALDPITEEMKHSSVEDRKLGRLIQWYSNLKSTAEG